ncbi:hypothetical protein DY000_02020302 [Brassica cretica]|uniref:Uncharacterized protein n=1 Tax=Brassica cretica TaxID=69181 RepID=A0ABQ7EIM7_BRACR|nr:hypothetical protein DY000_02020302 [Brassica cretica]
MTRSGMEYLSMYSATPVSVFRSLVTQKLVSIGMLIHMHFLWNHVDILVAAVCVTGDSDKDRVGMSVAEIGEFAFVLLSRVSNLHLIEQTVPPTSRDNCFKLENSSVSSEPISLAAIESNYIGNNPHCSTSSDQHTCVDSPLPESPYSRSEYPRTQSNEEDSTDKSVSIITKEHKLLTGIVQCNAENSGSRVLVKDDKYMQYGCNNILKTNVYNSSSVLGNLKHGRELASRVAHIANWSTNRGAGHHFFIGSCC